MNDESNKPPKKKRLTSKQQLFVQNYAQGMTGTDAVRAANYNVTSNNTASSVASQLLDLEHVQQALQVALVAECPDIHKISARTIYQILLSQESTATEKLKAIETLAKVFNWFNKTNKPASANNVRSIREMFKLPTE